MSQIKISLTEMIKPKTQKYILGEIFEKNKYRWLTKREVEKQLAYRWSFKDINDDISNINTIDELIEKANLVPGDLQRNIRLFYEKFRKYGLEKKEKDLNCDISYKWNPIDKCMTDNIDYPAARNIFKTQANIDIFCRSKNNKCEMCGTDKNNKDTLRMAVDHWRSHSVYNIDDVGIAVLLCESCNNIHHNYDASKIASKYSSNIKIIKNWVKKEKEIRDLGFPPNEIDLQTQTYIINELSEYHKTINPISNDFWEGLI